VQAAEALDASGADVAVRRPGGMVLLLGPWRLPRGEGTAIAAVDASAPRTRVQTIAVEISGNPATAEALRGAVDLVGLRRVVGE
jgi:hypothetical protein